MESPSMANRSENLALIRERIAEKLEKGESVEGYFKDVRGSNGTSVAFSAPDPNDSPRELKKLRGRHWKILTMHSLGIGNKDIAKTLGITPQTVCNTVTSEISQPVLKELQEQIMSPVADVAKILRVHMGGILEELIKMALDPSVKQAVRARIGLGLMDRGGHGPVRTNLNANATLSAEDLVNIVNRARDAGLEVQPDVVDAVIVEE